MLSALLQHKIFNSRGFKKVRLTLFEMVGRVMLFVLVNTGILIAMLGVDPPEAKLIPQAGWTDHMCGSETGTFATLLIFYNGGILAYGCYMVFQTRNVPSKFGENQAMLGSVYQTAICGLVGVGLGLGLDLKPNSRAVVTGMATVLGAFMCVGVLLFPKFYKIYMFDNGYIQEVSSMGQTQGTNLDHQVIASSSVAVAESSEGEIGPEQLNDALMKLVENADDLDCTMVSDKEKSAEVLDGISNRLKNGLP